MKVEIDWIRQLGSVDYDTATGLAVDTHNSIYITGSTQGILEGENRSGTLEAWQAKYEGTHAGSCDPWLAKYDRDGHQLWIEQLCTDSDDYALGLATSPQGFLYLAGITSGGGTGDEGELDCITAWVAKYTLQGKLIWLKRLGSQGDSYAHGIVSDSQGNVLLTGYTSGRLQPNHHKKGDYDAWVAKYDPEGNLVWLEQFGSASSDYARGIAIDSQNFIYLAGYTSGLIEATITQPGECDAWVAKYDPNGQQLWIKQFGSSDHEVATGIAVGHDDAIYLTGYTSGVIQGGGGQLGETDAWLVKYNSAGEQLWIVQLGSVDADYAYGIATDMKGGIYLTGATAGALEGGGGQVGGNDAWVAKYDSQGNQIWIKQLGTQEPDTAQAIALDRLGCIYLTGATAGALEGGASGGHGCLGCSSNGDWILGLGLRASWLE
jgi:hypothetical protein